MEVFKLKANLIIVGDSGVGKSSILKYYKEEIMNEAGVSGGLTLGAESVRLIASTKEGYDARLICWDYTGEKLMRTMVAKSIKTKAVVMIVFDVTDRQTFDDIWSSEDGQDWWSCVEENAHNQASRVLVGNKCDKEFEREVSTAEAEEIAKVKGMRYIETSGVTGTNVSVLVDICTENCVEKVKLMEGKGIDMLGIELDVKTITSRAIVKSQAVAKEEKERNTQFQKLIEMDHNSRSTSILNHVNAIQSNKSKCKC